MTPELRADFPVLQRRIDDRPIIYLDSAATSLKPYSVLKAEHAYSHFFTANVHRGVHALSEEASEAYESARRRVAAFLGMAGRDVVFVKNATEGLNQVASGLGLSSSDTVLVSAAEHHSNLLPWMRVAHLAWIDANPLEPLSPNTVAEAIELHRPKVVALAHASNVTGTVHPIRDICHIARSAGVITCVDASQSIPHWRLNVHEIGCDYLTFSGHKIMAPTGIGVLTGRTEAMERLEPLCLGGGCVDFVSRSGYTLKDIPYRLEAGTPNISGALGLAAAIDYFEALGFAAVDAHRARLADLLESILRFAWPGRLLMASSEPRLPIASLAMPDLGINPDQFSAALSENFGIMVRAGFHCVHPFFDQLGYSTGAIRASAYLYNTAEEVEALGRALRLLFRRLSPEAMHLVAG